MERLMVNSKKQERGGPANQLNVQFIALGLARDALRIVCLGDIGSRCKNDVMVGGESDQNSSGQKDGRTIGMHAFLDDSGLAGVL
eukprot:665281-Pelagomonas_calceolata.AAC.3